MLRIAVCDDDQVSLHNTVSIIENWSKQQGIQLEIAAFENGDELIARKESLRMDIIFLDIIMPLVNGMDVAKEIRQHDTEVTIIFLTSTPEFALESYDVKARGYLMKPVSYDRVKELLDDCSRSLETEPENLVLKTEFGYQKIYYCDIEYIEAQNKKVIIYTRDGKCVRTTQTLRSFESELSDREGFFKCHRSYIVYMPNVDHFNLSEINTRSGHCLPIARGYGKAFQEAYFSYMFQG